MSLTKHEIAATVEPEFDLECAWEPEDMATMPHTFDAAVKFGAVGLMYRVAVWPEPDICEAVIVYAPGYIARKDH